MEKFKRLSIEYEIRNTNLDGCPIIRKTKDHETLMSFWDDSSNITFLEWWDKIGSLLFNEYYKNK